MNARMRLAPVLAVAILAATAVPVLAAAPGNDDISSPVVVGALPYSNSQDTSEATAGATDPDCYGSGPTVWYAFTPDDSGWYQLDTFGSDYDTTLAVGTSDGAGGIDVLACNDDSLDVQSRVVIELAAGETYLAVVGAFGSGPGGSLVFNVDATSEPQILELSVGIDAVGRFLRDGTARISGTVECSSEAFGYLEVELTQKVGRFTVLGYGWAEFTCSPEAGTWQLDVSGITGRFAGGNAAVRLFAEAYDPVNDSYAWTEAQRGVRLAK